MPDTSQTSPAAFNLEGGLVLNRSTFMMQPGEALQLENFEPDIQGGYRRINGYTKHVNQVVPITNTTAEEPLMVASFNNRLLAARGERIYVSTSTPSLNICILTELNPPLNLTPPPVTEAASLKTWLPNFSI